jgi:nucleotide-binding universal stress UspA family protein
MVHISRILCPIDFSEFSRHALDHAAAVARWYEARLTVLYVFSAFSAMDMPLATMDEKEPTTYIGKSSPRRKPFMPICW